MIPPGAVNVRSGSEKRLFCTHHGELTPLKREVFLDSVGEKWVCCSVCEVVAEKDGFSFAERIPQSSGDPGQSRIVHWHRRQIGKWRCVNCGVAQFEMWNDLINHERECKTPKKPEIIDIVSGSELCTFKDCLEQHTKKCRECTAKFCVDHMYTNDVCQLCIMELERSS